MIQPRESWDLSILRDGYTGVLHARDGAYDGRRALLFVNGDSGKSLARVRWASRQMNRISLPTSLPRCVVAVHPGSGLLILANRDEQGTLRDVFSHDLVSGFSQPLLALSGARFLDVAHDGKLDRLFLATGGSAVFVMEGAEGAVTDSLVVGPGIAGIAVDSIHSRLAVARWNEADGIFTIEVFSTQSLARLFAVPIAEGARYRDVLIAPELQRMALVGDRDLLVLDEFGQTLYRAVFDGSVRAWDLDPRSSSALLLVTPGDPGFKADQGRLHTLSLARPEKDSLDLDGSPSALFARAETQEVLILHEDCALLRVLHVPSRTIRTSMALGHGIDGLEFASDGSLWVADASGQGHTLSLLTPGRPYRSLSLDETPGELVSQGASMYVALPRCASLARCDVQPAQVLTRLDLPGFPARKHTPWLRLATRDHRVLVGDPLPGRAQVIDFVGPTSDLLFFPPAQLSRDSASFHLIFCSELDQGVIMRAADSRALLFSLTDPRNFEERALALPSDPAEGNPLYLRPSPNSGRLFIGSREWDLRSNTLSAPLAPPGSIFLYRDSSDAYWFLILRDSTWSLQAVASDGTPLREFRPLIPLSIGRVAVDATRQRFALGFTSVGKVEIYETGTLLDMDSQTLALPSPRIECFPQPVLLSQGVYPTVRILSEGPPGSWTLRLHDQVGKTVWERHDLRTGQSTWLSGIPSLRGSYFLVAESHLGYRVVTTLIAF